MKKTAFAGLAFLLIGLILPALSGCRDSGRDTTQETPSAAEPASQPESLLDWPFGPEEAVRRQGEAAKRLGESKDLTLDLGKDVTLKLVLIPPGRFIMGSPRTEQEEALKEAVAMKTEKESMQKLLSTEVQHQVTISNAFYMGIHEVTEAQYRQVVGTYSKSMFSTEPPEEIEEPRLPASNVTWDQAVAFCERLSANSKRKVRLPTEAEWEYACRAGTATPFHTGETISSDEANLDGTQPWGSGRQGVLRDKLVPVGGFTPNAWGLYDMHGNAVEWCSDLFDEQCYSSAAKVDPQGPPTSPTFVPRYIVRGGHYACTPGWCRSSFRLHFPQSFAASGAMGFRVVVELGGVE